MFRALSLLALALLFALPRICAQSTSPLQAGRYWFSAERYDSAMACFERARVQFAQQPDSLAEANIRLAYCHTDIGDYPCALPLLHEAVRTAQPSSTVQADAMIALGLANWCKQYPDSSLYWLRRAEPFCTGADVGRQFQIALYSGMAYAQKEDLPPALHWLRKAEALSLGADAYERARLYAHLGGIYGSLGWEKSKAIAAHKMLEALPGIPHQAIRWSHILLAGGSLIKNQRTADSLARRLDSLYTLRLGEESINKAYALGWLSNFAASDSAAAVMLERKGEILREKLGTTSAPYISNQLGLFWKYQNMKRTKECRDRLEEAERILAQAPTSLQDVYYPSFWIYKALFWQFVSVNRDSALFYYQKRHEHSARRLGVISITGTGTALLEAALQNARGDSTAALQLLDLRRNAVLSQAGDSSTLMLGYYQSLAEHYGKWNHSLEAQAAWENLDRLTVSIYGRYSTQRESPLFNLAFARFFENKRHSVNVLRELEEVVARAEDMTERERKTSQRNVCKYLYFAYGVMHLPDSADFYLDKWERQFDSDSPSYLNDLSNLASLARLRGDWAGYERNFEQARQQFEKNIQRGVRDLQLECFFLDEMGEYYLGKGQCDSAQICYDRYRLASIQREGANSIWLNKDFLQNELQVAQCRGVPPDSLIRMRERIVVFHQQYNADNLEQLAGQINSLASEYRFIGDMPRFMLLNEQALVLQDSLVRLHPDDATYQTDYLFQKASLNRFANAPDTALVYYRKALRLAQEKQLPAHRASGYFISIGLVLFHNHAFAEAAGAFEQALALRPDDGNPDHLVRRLQAKSWLGYAHYGNKEPEKMKGFAEYLLARVDSIRGDNGSATEFCLDAAFFLRKHQQYAASVAAAQKALRIAGAAQTGNAFDPLRVVGKSNLVARGYDYLTQSYRRWYEATHLRPLLDSSALYAHYAIEAQEAQENSAGQSSPDVRLSMRQSAGDYYYEEAIRAEMSYAQADRDLARQANAFALCERSKAAVFRQTMQQQQSAVRYDVAPELLAAERSIEQQIRAIETLRFQMQQAAAAADGGNRRDDLAPRLLQLYARRDSLASVFQRRYPDYHQLRYDQKNMVTVRDLQTRVLKPGQTLVEYFWTDSLLAMFVVRPDLYQVRMMQPDSALAGQLEDFLREVRRPSPSLPVLLSSGRYLYHQLLEPVDSLLTDELIMVPSGRLHLLPFEALLTNDNILAEGRDRPWLLRKHSVRYAVSSTVLAQTLRRERKTSSRRDRRLVAFAPQYAGLGDRPEAKRWAHEPNPGTRGNLDDLPNNRIEIEDIATQIGPEVPGKTLVSSREATRDRFERACQDAWLLHFAGHAKSYDHAGQYSFLVFSYQPDSLDRVRLFARDVYGLRLHRAEMVVLSGCETGLGQVQTGEGVIGLGRAFAYAGTRSLAFSLWSVSDAAASRLMPDFYGLLRQGLPKQAALRQAKIKLLDQGLSPFFWAPFVLYGDGRAIF